MKPSTLMRIWIAFDTAGATTWGDGHPLHTLKIAGETCLWPGAVYRARTNGYLRQVEPGMYLPTEKMLTEVRQHLRTQEMKAAS